MVGDRLEGEGEMMPPPGLKGRAWTAEDDDRLKSLIEASVSIHLIAEGWGRETTHREDNRSIDDRERYVGLRHPLPAAGKGGDRSRIILALSSRRWLRSG